MIQANELRIGNLVINHLNEIHTIKPNNILAQYRFDVAGEHGYTPITITEEWLLKFGFEKQDNDIDVWYQIEIKDGYFLEYFKSMTYISLILREVNNVVGDSLFYLPNIPKFVHELQNLYFALTQTELKINE